MEELPNQPNFFRVHVGTGREVVRPVGNPSARARSEIIVAWAKRSSKDQPLGDDRLIGSGGWAREQSVPAFLEGWYSRRGGMLGVPE